MNNAAFSNMSFTAYNNAPLTPKVFSVAVPHTITPREITILKITICFKSFTAEYAILLDRNETV